MPFNNDGIGNFMSMATSAMPISAFPVTPPPKKKEFTRKKQFHFNDGASQKSAMSDVSAVSVAPPQTFNSGEKKKEVSELSYNSQPFFEMK